MKKMACKLSLAGVLFLLMLSPDAYDTTYGGEYYDAFISLFDSDLSSGRIPGHHRNRGF